LRSRIARFAALLPACLALCAVATLCLAGEAKEEELEAVKIKYPLISHPMRASERCMELYRSGELEPVSSKPRPPFLAPRGTRNVALKKPVTSSDQEPLRGELNRITDGDKKSLPHGQPQVELRAGRQWVQIDLEASHNIHAVVVWHSLDPPRIYHDVVVQIADDADFIHDVRTIYNNDRDNSSGFGMGTDREYVETYEGRLIPCKGVTGRFVRLNSKGNVDNELNHYLEVEVYATPAK
jgi:hypothetical protein